MRGLQHLEFDFCSGIAQPVEQAAVNRKVQGSNPCPGAKLIAGCLARRVPLRERRPEDGHTTSGLEAPWRLSSRHFPSVDVDGVDPLVEERDHSGDRCDLRRRALVAPGDVAGRSVGR